MEGEFARRLAIQGRSKLVHPRGTKHHIMMANPDIEQADGGLCKEGGSPTGLQSPKTYSDSVSSHVITPAECDTKAPKKRLKKTLT